MNPVSRGEEGYRGMGAQTRGYKKDSSKLKRIINQYMAPITRMEPKTSEGTYCN